MRRENEQLKRELARLDRVLDIGKSLVSVLSLDGVLIRIVEAASLVTGAEESVLMLLDKQTNELYVKTQKGLGDPYVQALRLRVSDSLAGQVLRTGEPLRVSEESKVVTGYRVGAALAHEPGVADGHALAADDARNAFPGQGFELRYREQFQATLARRL